MKNIFYLLLLLAATQYACKSTPEKTPEEKKAETTVKSDKEKADSVLKYYQDKMKEVPDTLPELKPRQDN